MKKLFLFVVVAAFAVLLSVSTAFALHPDGPLAYWPLDEGIGSTAADAAHSSDGELSGGIDGNAVEFDGVDDYISVPEPADESLDVADQLTIEAWVEAEVIDTYKSIVVKGDAYTEGKINYGLQILGSSAESVADGVLRFFVYNGSYAYRTSTGTIPSDGELHHVAVTVDTATDTIEFYIDGTLTDTFTNFTSSLPDSDSSLEIGRHRHASLGAYQYWDGRIDEVRISDSVVYTTNFSPSAPLSASGAIGLWHMNESVDDTVFDAANSNDGTLMNGATWAGPIWSTSLSFDGVDDFVEAPDSGSPDLDGFTGLSLLAWITPEGQGSGPCTPIPNLGSVAVACGGIISKYNTDTSFVSYYLATAADELRLFVAKNSSNYAWETTTSTNLVPGTMYHVAGTWDGTSFHLYVDGVAAASIEHVGKGLFPDSMINTTVPVNIGRFGFATAGNDFGYFDGVIDEPCIFDRALTPVEIALFAGDLACDETATITLSPDAAFNPIDTAHSVTATISPAVAGIPVAFEITAGPNAGDTWTGSTDGSGEATFTYAGDGYTGPGTEVDSVVACIDLDESGSCSLDEPQALATKTWFDIDNPAWDFCTRTGLTNVGTIKELDTHTDAGVIVSSSIEVPADGGDVSVYILNMGAGDITFLDPAWSVKGTAVPRNVPTSIPLTPKGSEATFWDRGWGGTFGETVDLLGCVNFTDIIPITPGEKATAHLDLAFLRNGTPYKVRVNFHFR